MKIKRYSKFWLILGSALIIIIVGVVTYLYMRNSSSTTGQPNSSGIYNPNTNNPTSSVPASNTNKDPSGGGVATTKEGSNSAPSIDASTQPSAPTGTFVSNHRPNLSGKPAPSSETSTCTTTPGAQCKISFSMNGIVKSLPTQQTDGNGNTSWTWTLQDIGLTTGSWKISATAINGTKTANATDQLDLVVAE